jgi:hypothetical protein
VADPLLLVPAALFLATTAYGTAVAAARPELRGEMFGLRIPGRVRTHLALGVGSAISAPWPMPVVAMVAAVRGTPGSKSAALTMAVVGSGMLAGVLAEPVTWGRRPATPAAQASVPLHLAVGAAMVAAGTHRLRQQAGAAPAGARAWGRSERRPREADRWGAALSWWPTRRPGSAGTPGTARH